MNDVSGSSFELITDKPGLAIYHGEPIKIVTVSGKRYLIREGDICHLQEAADGKWCEFVAVYQRLLN